MPNPVDVKDPEPRDCSHLITESESREIFDIFIKEENIKAKLVKYEMISEHNTVGFIGDYYHYKIYYHKIGDEKNEMVKKLFAKSMPYSHAKLAEVCKKSGIVKKEVEIYVNLLKELHKYSKTVWSPRCYLARPDIIVLENLEDLGYTQVKEHLSFLSNNDLKAVMKSLAAMHAGSIAYEQLHKVNIGEKFKDVLSESIVSSINDWYMAAVKAVVTMALKHPVYQSEPLQFFIKHQLSKIMNSVTEMVKPSTEYYNVFSHGDIWAGNIFSKPDNDVGKGVILVDYQFSRYAPPAIDVLIALYLNTHPRERKHVMDECLRYYYESLESELEEHKLNVGDYLSQVDFYKAIKQFRLFGAVYNCIMATIIRLPNKILRVLRWYREDEYFTFLNSDRTQAVSDCMALEMKYRNYLSDCIADLMELLMKDRKLC